MATVEERFRAAVNVIKGLPKNGPYQPSTAMMLKFYGYFKQATEGPCQHRKPAFWDVIGKAKWDAWNDNRHLTKQQAMQKYVEDLREIIETMSFTENVQNFVGSVSGLDNINLDELEMIAPGMREIAESHPNSPFHSRTNSPQHGSSANENHNDVSTTNGHVTHLNGSDHVEEDNSTRTPPPTPNQEQETQEHQQQITASLSQKVTTPLYATTTIPSGIVEQSDDEYVDPIDINHDLTEAMIHNSEVLKQIQATVLRMNADLVAVNHRMSALEKTVNDVRASVLKSAKSSGNNKLIRQYPKWWPFNDISPSWFVLLVLWPFIVNRVSRMLLHSRRK